jgi:hypothetical protein
MHIARRSGDSSGACVTAVLIRGRSIAVANVGDCRAVLRMCDGTLKVLTMEHRCVCPEMGTGCQSSGLTHNPGTAHPPLHLGVQVLGALRANSHPQCRGLHKGQSGVGHSGAHANDWWGVHAPWLCLSAAPPPPTPRPPSRARARPSALLRPSRIHLVHINAFAQDVRFWGCGIVCINAGDLDEKAKPGVVIPTPDIMYGPPVPPPPPPPSPRALSCSTLRPPPLPLPHICASRRIFADPT